VDADNSFTADPISVTADGSTLVTDGDQGIDDRRHDDGRWGCRASDRGGLTDSAPVRWRTGAERVILCRMANGGFTRLPGGKVVVALRLPRPAGCGEEIRVIVLAVNRQRALTRLRNLGFRGARLSGNAEPPTPDETTAVLHHPDALIWRPAEAAPAAPWQPIAALLGQPPS
jgi:hypothetical protein